MKNKLIINIVLVYFVLLAVVLVIQLNNNRNNNVSTEPLKDSVRYSDILSDCVVLYDRSPVMLVKQKQKLVNNEKAACVPVIEEKVALVPIDFFKEAFGAVVSSDESRNSATVRLNNKAMVVDGKNGVITLVSASKEKTLETKGYIEFRNDCAYISLDGFAEGFDKQLSIYDSMALLSDRELNLKDNEVSGFTAEVEPQVNNLPSVDEQQKLEELLGSGAVNIFNTIGETIGIQKEESPVSTLGLDATGIDTPSYLRTDGSYIYFIRDNSLNIATIGERPETISSTEIDLSKIYGIYVDGNYVSVIGEGIALADNSSDFSGCTIVVYDITDKSKPVITRQIGAEGSYSQACKKEDTVYLFVKKEAENADSFDMPACYDSANSAVGESKSLSEVRYVPEMADKAYTSILGFNIRDMGRALNVYTILGCGDNYSLTGSSLYIAAASVTGTSMYRLALDDGSIKYSAAGFTLGDIPDNACMNEYNGVLRLAIKKEDKVQVTLLDEKMEELDSLENISIDGQLVSTRFIGSRGYLVSDSADKSVFAVDLKEKIKEIGSINIPQGTNAVRNFDAEHFICVKNDGSISMLNISDINNQSEVFAVQTGGKCDSNGLLLNVDEGILAVPVELNTLEPVTELTTEAVSQEGTDITEETTNEKATVNSEGGSVWQGVFVYIVDLQNNGFVHVDRISHITDGYDTQSIIKYVLYKDNRLYTVSDKEVKSNYIK